MTRGYSSNSATLVEDGQEDWAANRIHEVYGHQLFKRMELNIFCQLQVYGCDKEAAFYKNGNGNKNSYTFRDCTLFSVLDAFYYNGKKGKQCALHWEEIYDSEQVDPLLTKKNVLNLINERFVRLSVTKSNVLSKDMIS